jgi:hypothetical protein
MASSNVTLCRFPLEFQFQVTVPVTAMFDRTD